MDKDLISLTENPKEKNDYFWCADHTCPHPLLSFWLLILSHPVLYSACGSLCRHREHVAFRSSAIFLHPFLLFILPIASLQSILKEINPEYSLEGLVTAEAEALILWPLDEKSQFIGKDRDAGKDWQQEEKGVTEDEMVGWHHWLNGREFKQTREDGERQGSLT